MITLIKILGLFLLSMAMFGIGYFCGHVLTGLRYETGGDNYDR